MLVNPEANYVLVSNRYGEVWFMKSIDVSEKEAIKIQEHMGKIYNFFDVEYYSELNRVKNIIRLEYSQLEEEYKKIDYSKWKSNMNNDMRVLMQEYENKLLDERNEKISKQFIYYLNQIGIITDRIILED